MEYGIVGVMPFSLLSLYKQATVKYHMAFHALGAVMVLSAIKFWGGELQNSTIAVAIIGSFLPDVDHILFFYTYGRKSVYSRKVRKLVARHKFRQAGHFCGVNHKHLHGLYSHNFVSVFLVLFIGVTFLRQANWVGAAFWLAMLLHFLYDIFEDFMLKGKLNSNWWLRFDQSVRAADLKEG